MAIAINVRAENDSAKAVEQLWDQIAAFEDKPSMRALAYRPHFTFAIYDSPELDQETATQAMLRVATNERQLRVEFERIRWFDGPPLVLWMDPLNDAVLRRWHASISATIDPAYCRNHYQPGQWTPHCTLGMRIIDGKRDDAKAFARTFNRGLTVVFDVADCVVFPPARVFAEHKLSPLLP